MILNTVLLPEWSTAVFFCLVIVVHESLVCLEQLNCLLFFRKILQVLHILWFFSIFCAFEPFPTMTFQQWLIHIFTLRITEGLICIYYRRLKCSLMLQKETQCSKSRGGENFFNLKIRVNLTYFVFWETCIFCSFWRAVLNGKIIIAK